MMLGEHRSLDKRELTTRFPLGNGFTLAVSGRAARYFKNHPDELKRDLDAMKAALDDARAEELHVLIYGLCERD
jgi:hypothetical protein